MFGLGLFILAAASSLMFASLGVRLAGFSARLDSSMHWAERARCSWPARRGLQMAAWTTPLGVGLLVLVKTNDGLLALAGAAGSWIGITLVLFRIVRALRGGVRTHDYFLRLRTTFVHRSWLALIALFVPLCSSRFDVRTVSVLVVGGGLLVLYLRYGVVELGRWVGLYHEPPTRLSARVVQVAKVLNLLTPCVYLMRRSEPIALAFVGSNTIAASNGALTLLDDAQLDTLLAHEMGHLAEPWRVQLLRHVAFVPIMGWAAYYPLVEQFGLAVYLV